MGTKSIHTLGDPLGSISRRYAEDSKNLTQVKEYIIQDTLSKGVQIPIYGATYPELSKLFGLQESRAPFASFPKAPENFLSSYTLFPSILPSIGSVPQIQEALEKIKNFKATGKNIDEKNVLTNSLKKALFLEQIYTIVNAKRNQYGKG